MAARNRPERVRRGDAPAGRRAAAASQDLRELRTYVEGAAPDSAPDSGALAEPRRYRRRTLAGSLVGAAAVVVLAVVMVAGQGTAAYALQQQQDGDVVIRIHDLSDLDGLEAAFSDVGISAEVERGPVMSVVRGGSDADTSDEGAAPATPPDSNVDGPDPYLTVRRSGSDMLFTVPAELVGTHTLHLIVGQISSRETGSVTWSLVVRIGE